MKQVKRSADKVGFEDPVELGFARTFRKPGPFGGHLGRDQHVVAAKDFPAYLDELRILMRKCLDNSEKARDTYYALKDAYQKEKGLEGHALDEALKLNAKAQKAISDNVMYDRWAMKYAEVLQAEVAYANFMGWGKP